MIIFICVGSAHADSPKNSSKQSAWAKFRQPAPGVPEVVGSYANGCLVGGAELSASGPGYQSIRRYRQRFFGHPRLIAFIERFGQSIKSSGFDDILVGDLSQIRGGPLPFGHRSHQLGLDADLWFTAPQGSDRKDDKNFPSLVNVHTETIDRDVWSERISNTLRLAAEDKDVARIFVHWVIKHELCKSVDKDRSWLRKVRPWWGHSRHFHVRLHCPKDSAACISQATIPEGDGCGKEHWFSAAQVKSRRARSKRVKKGRKKKKRAPRVLPAKCRRMLPHQR